MRVLGIETSCDETAVSIIDAAGGIGNFSYSVLGNTLLSQASLHAQYGGVFPNLAKREHGRNLVPLLGEALKQANMLDERTEIDEDTIGAIEKILEREHELFEFLASFLRMYGKPPIDCIAVTHGPGLEPALWVGVNFAKALSRAWNIPIVPVNHMEGHVMISTLNDRGMNDLAFPLLSLLISGGHTEILLSREWMQYERIGETRDDAVGEAFDKVARLLGLPYPGGPEISKLAAEARGKETVATVSLPRPMIDTNDFDFSFSGLKTAVRKVVEAEELTEERKKAIALEFENAATDVLVAKTMRAIEEYGAQTIVVGGGVSANTHIRTSLAQTIKDFDRNTKLLIPPTNLATDNALMIALSGYFRAQRGEYAEPDSIRANGNLKLAN